MMVSEELKMVYIDPPKTGSSTMDDICKAHGFKFVKYRNPSIQRGKKVFNKHLRWVPKEYQDFLTFATVRNPYTRMFSMYHFDKAHKYNFLKHVKLKTFKDYVDGVVKGSTTFPVTNHNLMLYRYLPLHKYLSVARVDKFVRLENLYSDLENLGIKVEKERTLNKGKYVRTWEDVKTPYLIDQINTWAGDDFELYGYEKL
jgi:hypothetical protein